VGSAVVLVRLLVLLPVVVEEARGGSPVVVALQTVRGVMVRTLLHATVRRISPWEEALMFIDSSSFHTVMRRDATRYHFLVEGAVSKQAFKQANK
jgi:hypothetical protein